MRASSSSRCLVVLGDSVELRASRDTSVVPRCSVVLVIASRPSSALHLVSCLRPCLRRPAAPPSTSCVACTNPSYQLTRLARCSRELGCEGPCRAPVAAVLIAAATLERRPPFVLAGDRVARWTYVALLLPLKTPASSAASAASASSALRAARRVVSFLLPLGDWRRFRVGALVSAGSRS